MKVLVTGAKGMLGQAVVSAIEAREWTTIPLSRRDLDVTDVKEVRNVLVRYRPDVVVNCAAYTDVDGAETAREKAFAVNGLGPRNLALVCRDAEADLVQVSTDYVFDGNKAFPYEIFDDPRPLNVYGASKLWGEQAVATIGCRWYIVRTSWLFGPGGKNFVETILRSGKKSGVLRVVNDQNGCPTYTIDLARAIADLIETRCYGIYHVTNQGSTTWFNFAQKISEKANLPVVIEPCSTTEFPRPAVRPKNSLLDSFPLRETIGYLLPAWEDALERYLAVIGKEEVS